MREEFMIERHGKKFVLYAGLLAEAHERGLVSIETELIQSPSDENHGLAIVEARAKMAEEVDTGTVIKTFTGIGDANPDNVAKNIVPHLIRMAETRAKARALRDAINVGVTAFEELGGDEEPAIGPQAKTGTVYPLKDDDAPATGAQKSRIHALVTTLKSSMSKFEQKHGPLDELSYGAAAQFIAEADDYLDRQAK